jgi:hypothetical protein
MDDAVVFRVRLPSNVMGMPAFVDLNGDGRRDLVISNLTTPAKLWVLWGRSTTGETIDLTTGVADLEITLPGPCGAVGAGDVNGDGREDLVLGMKEGRGRAALVWGKDVFPPSIAWNDPLYAVSFLGDSRDDGMLGNAVVVADVNGDGYSDVFLSAFSTYINGNHRGRIYGFFGAMAPGWGVWDLTTATVPVVLDGTSGVYYGCTAGAGDFDGDGRSDLLIYTYHYAKMAWLSGAELTPGGRLSISSSPPFHPLYYHLVPHTGDFDGDGRDDLFAHEQNAVGGVGWLSSGGDGVEHPKTRRLIFNDGNAAEAVGDLDGDGRADVVRFGVFTSGSEQTVRLSVYYGFRPFWSPSVTIRRRSESSTTLRLDLAPDGEATSVRIDGDVIGPTAGVWMPFRTPIEVEVSPEAGSKRLSVTFREPGGRTSAAVTQSFALDSGAFDVRVRRNRVGYGQDAVWEIVTHGGRVTADVYDVEGRHVRGLMNLERPAGVWTLRWDGRTASGARVAAGVYVLSVESDGDRRRLRVLVTP